MILHADPDAPYQAMIRVYDELMSSEAKTGVPIQNLAIPTQREIEEYVKVFGRNPFAESGE